MNIGDTPDLGGGGVLSCIVLGYIGLGLGLGKLNFKVQCKGLVER